MSPINKKLLDYSQSYFFSVKTIQQKINSTRSLKMKMEVKLEGYTINMAFLALAVHNTFLCPRQKHNKTLTFSTI